MIATEVARSLQDGRGRGQQRAWCRMEVLRENAMADSVGLVQRWTDGR